jgi:hypothetical protein
MAYECQTKSSSQTRRKSEKFKFQRKTHTLPGIRTRNLWVYALGFYATAFQSEVYDMQFWRIYVFMYLFICQRT